MQEIKTYKTKALVLQVSKTYNPLTLKFDEWNGFLDILCNNREYQKEAIRDAIIYMASGRYKSIEDLITENWKDSSNAELRTRYKDVREYIDNLQLPDKFSGNIDLATGTGKSYVIYGIAQIMLGIGLVDKVLVLCPSLTIEKGLKEKFEALASDSKLKQAIPLVSKYKNPRIIQATQTIKQGDICVENIHAVYDKTSSSIKESIKGNGQRVLVLNDEAHHIFNDVQVRDKDIKKWKEFLGDPDYDFRYILGFTGTAYINNDYFNDVIYRYSLRQAVDDNMIKLVEYVSKDDSIDTPEKLQKIYSNHKRNKSFYHRVKPLTILITKDIVNARRLAEEILDFLVEKEKTRREKAERKVLIITSHQDHKANVAKLSWVDDIDNPVEWIVSVSMLTEGWDVKNVFQIVPWEDRAFNSKLLIAQVLGRGLRIPPEYQTPQPKVTVFNHDAWSKNIKGLVDEILEIEMKLQSSILITGTRAAHNFELYTILYEKKQREKLSKKSQKVFDYTKGYIELIAQVEESDKDTEYTDLHGNVREQNTTIEYNTFTIDEVVNKLYDEFKVREWEGKTLKLPEGEYTKNNLPPKNEIKKIIRESMNKVGIKGDRLVVKNKYKIESMFSTLLRKKNMTVINERLATEPEKLSTKNIERESIAVGNLRHHSSVFYTDDFGSELSKETADILQQVIDDGTFSKNSSKAVNPHLFKTPVDIVFAKSDPERRFIEMLCKKENAEKIDSWVKSRDGGFYHIEYTITTVAGRHTKQQSYNPDFFIKIVSGQTTYVIVVEIKIDRDDSQENKAKLRYARQHFVDLNNELKSKGVKQHYIFHFLSPENYTEFFDYLRRGELIQGNFRSELEDLLQNIEQE